MAFKAKGQFADKSKKTTNKSSKAKWFRQTPELIEEAQSSNRTSRSKFFRTDLLEEFKLKDFSKDGINKIRILPVNVELWKDAKSFGMNIWVHDNVGEGFEIHMCSERMRKGPCPACERSRELMESGNKADVKVGERMKAKSRVIFLIVDRNDEEGLTRFFSAPYTKIGMALHNLQTDKEDGSIIQIVDPFEGRDILIQYNKPPKNASMAEINNVYPAGCVSLSNKVTALDNEEALAFVTENIIPDLIVYTPYEELQQAMFGDVDDDKEDDSKFVTAGEEDPTIDGSEDEKYNDALSLESVREMDDDELSKVLRDNGVSESDIEDMTTAEKRKMIRDNMDLV
jgi:hypothetical protein